MTGKVYKVRKNGCKVFVWLLIGIFFSLSGMAMHISEDGNLNSFLNLGEIYDVAYDQMNSSGDGWITTLAEGSGENIEITADAASKKIYLNGNPKDWTYLSVEISDLSLDKVNLNIICYDANGNIVSNCNTDIVNGINNITIHGTNVSSFMFSINNEQGCSFGIKNVKLSNKILSIDKNEMWKTIDILFLIYIIVSAIVLYVFHRKKFHMHSFYDACIQFLQLIYCKIINTIIGERKVSKKIASVLRTAIFLLLIVYSIVKVNMGTCHSQWKEMQIVYFIAILLISLLSIEKAEMKNWSNKLVYAWMSFWILTCISDFMVHKKYAYVGYVQLFLWGFLFFIWNNMEEPQELLKDFAKAVHISFIGAVVFCILCRPESSATRYMGAFINPNPFANYLAVVLGVLLTELMYSIFRGGRKRRILWKTIEINMLFFFLLKTQTRGALLVCILLIVVTLVSIRHFLPKKSIKYMLLYLFCGIILYVPVHTTLSWAINTVPYELESNIIMDRDIYQPVVSQSYGLGSMVVYASDYANKLSQSRIVSSLKLKNWEYITSGRTTIWKAYIREMNLWGHSWRVMASGSARDSHNAVLEIAFRYGIFTIIPYCLIWIYFIKYSWQYLWENTDKEWSFLPFCFCIVYIVCALVDAEEQPYMNLCWFAAYFSMGIMFHKKIK